MGKLLVRGAVLGGVCALVMVSNVGQAFADTAYFNGSTICWDERDSATNLTLTGGSATVGATTINVATATRYDYRNAPAYSASARHTVTMTHEPIPKSHEVAWWYYNACPPGTLPLKAWYKS